MHVRVYVYRFNTGALCGLNSLNNKDIIMHVRTYIYIRGLTLRSAVTVNSLNNQDNTSVLHYVSRLQ